MRARLLNISFYFGFAPLFSFYRVFTRRAFSTNYHFRHALALSFLLFCSLFAFAAVFGIHQVILFSSRALFSFLPLETSFYVLGILLSGCLVLWLVGVVTAAIGTSPRILLLSGITRRKRLMWFSIAWSIFLQACIVLVVTAAIYSTHLARAEATSADVYMLYDDMGYVPRWVFTLSFYRESRAATDRWGGGSVVVAPLSEPALNRALRNGRFVFIASHGVKGDILLSGGIPYWPRDVDRANIGPRLQYVYLAGCDTGLLRASWKNALAPAEVKTFDRLSSPAEHFFWLLRDGPKAINTLE